MAENLFKVDDRVQAIKVMYYTGQLATVVKVTPDLVYVIFDGEASRRGFFHYRFKLAEPDTPFNAAVRAYIQRELPNGSA